MDDILSVHRTTYLFPDPDRVGKAVTRVPDFQQEPPLSAPVTEQEKDQSILPKIVLKFLSVSCNAMDYKFSSVNGAGRFSVDFVSLPK